jgi:hypothetical protein
MTSTELLSDQALKDVESQLRLADMLDEQANRPQCGLPAVEAQRTATLRRRAANYRSDAWVKAGTVNRFRSQS